MNKVMLIGRLTADPEIRTTQSGVSNCTFSIAVRRRFMNKATNTYETDFINCVAWRNQAELIAKHFIKGNLIGIEGTWQVRKYEAQDGSKRTANECVVENVDFVGGKNESSAPTNNLSGTFAEIDDDNDLPF